MHLTQRITDIPSGTGAAILRIAHAMSAAAPLSWLKLLTSGEAGALAEASNAVCTYGLRLGESGAFSNRTKALSVRDSLTNSSDLVMALRKLYDLFSAFVPTASIRGSQSLTSKISQVPAQSAIIDAAKAAGKQEAAQVAVAAALRASLFPTTLGVLDSVTSFITSAATVDGAIDMAKATSLAGALGNVIASGIAGVAIDASRLEALDAMANGAANVAATAITNARGRGVSLTALKNSVPLMDLVVTTDLDESSEFTQKDRQKLYRERRQQMKDENTNLELAADDDYICQNDGYFS